MVVSLITLASLILRELVILLRNLNFMNRSQCCFFTLSHARKNCKQHERLLMTTTNVDHTRLKKPFTQPCVCRLNKEGSCVGVKCQSLFTFRQSRNLITVNRDEFSLFVAVLKQFVNENQSRTYRFELRVCANFILFNRSYLFPGATM